MTDLLRVSGIPVPVLVDSASHAPRAIGEVGEAEDGTKLIDRRAIKEDFKIKVAHRTPTEGIAWKKLFMGEGQTWNFNSDLYGSKGLGPSAATDASSSSAKQVYGAASCELLSGTGTISYAALPAGGTKWTVIAWRHDGNDWHHFGTTSALKAAGDAYVDGVYDGAEGTSWLTVTTATGTVKLDAEASKDTYLDDLVILPFEVPVEWFAYVYDYGAAFSQLAKLNIDGDLVDAGVGTKTVCPSVKGVDVVPGYLDGVYYQSIRVLEVDLEEG